MRRALVSLVAVSSCLIAGACGSSSSSTVSSPLSAELSYLPAGSLFVAAIATNPQSPSVQKAQGLLGAFPTSRLGITAVESGLSALGLDYRTDVEPLYGNPVAFAVPQLPSAVSVSGSSFLAAWITKSASKLAALVKKVPGLTSTGNLDGATVYREAGSSTTVAIDGATVVVGASAASVDAALNRHAHGGGITSADFTNAMGTLPRDTFIQAFGSLTGVLSTPQLATARKVPWVAAIRSYAAAISAGSTGLAAQFRIDTSGGALTTSELPIASGTAAPALAGTLPIAVGLRDPSSTFNFLVSALEAAAPATYAEYFAGEDLIKISTGYDLQTLAALLTGNMVLQSDTRTTMVRADVSDPASAAKQLDLLPILVRDIGLAPTVKRSDGFYSIKEANGKSLNAGLVGNQLVAGLATPAQLRAFATAPATPVPNAQGASLGFRIALLDLLPLVDQTAPSPVVRSILSSLGDIIGSASATTGAITGNASLPVK